MKFVKEIYLLYIICNYPWFLFKDVSLFLRQEFLITTIGYDILRNNALIIWRRAVDSSHPFLLSMSFKKLSKQNKKKLLADMLVLLKPTYQIWAINILLRTLFVAGIFNSGLFGSLRWAWSYQSEILPCATFLFNARS